MRFIPSRLAFRLRLAMLDWVARGILQLIRWMLPMPSMRPAPIRASRHVIDGQYRRVDERTPW